MDLQTILVLEPACVRGTCSSKCGIAAIGILFSATQVT